MNLLNGWWRIAWLLSTSDIFILLLTIWSLRKRKDKMTGLMRLMFFGMIVQSLVVVLNVLFRIPFPARLHLSVASFDLRCLFNWIFCLYLIGFTNGGHGEKGERGERGETGKQGKQGETGKQGEQGERGTK